MWILCDTFLFYSFIIGEMVAGEDDTDTKKMQQDAADDTKEKLFKKSGFTSAKTKGN